jgi:hypothetical protein
MRMTSVMVAVSKPHGAASALGSGTHWFAIGLLVGILAVFFAPAWLTGLIIVFDLVALGWSSGILTYAHSAHGRWVLVAVPFLLLGLYIGVLRGLRHLSDSELATRLGNIRRMGRYF